MSSSTKTNGIHVHNAEYFETLRQNAAANASNSMSPIRSSKNSMDSVSRSHGSSLSSSLSPSKPTAADLAKETQQKRVALKHQQYHKDQETFRKKIATSIADQLQKQHARKESRFMKLRKEVEDGKVLAEELREKLDLQEQSKHRQFQRMHDDWTVHVFDKLNDPIVHQVEQIPSKELNSQKRTNYQRFLDITNKKGGLFRDIIIESEYNPLHDVSYLRNRSKVDDPIKRVIRRREEENAIAQEGRNLAVGDVTVDPATTSTSTSTSDGSGCGRNDNLDVKLWSKGVFESTPYGYFNKMMDTTKPLSENSTKLLASGVQFDHYTIETGPEVLQKEIPKGKRTSFDESIVIKKPSIQLR